MFDAPISSLKTSSMKKLFEEFSFIREIHSNICQLAVFPYDNKYEEKLFKVNQKFKPSFYTILTLTTVWKNVFYSQLKTAQLGSLKVLIYAWFQDISVPTNVSS